MRCAQSSTTRTLSRFTRVTTTTATRGSSTTEATRPMACDSSGPGWWTGASTASPTVLGIPSSGVCEVKRSSPRRTMVASSPCGTQPGTRRTAVASSGTVVSTTRARAQTRRPGRRAALTAGTVAHRRRVGTHPAAGDFAVPGEPRAMADRTNPTRRRIGVTALLALLAGAFLLPAADAAPNPDRGPKTMVALGDSFAPAR